MPEVLVQQSEAERGRIAEALTHFLIAQSKTVFQIEAPGQIDLQQGKSLYHSVGCVACHGPKEALADALQKPNRNDEDDDEEDKKLNAKKSVMPMVVPLGHVAAKYSAKSLSEFLFQPLRVRISGRMPDMKLTPAESLAIAGYLIGEQTLAGNALVPEAPLVAKGKQFFQEMKRLRSSRCGLPKRQSRVRRRPIIASVGSSPSRDLSAAWASQSGGDRTASSFHEYVCSVTPIFLIASMTVLPLPTSTSTSRSLGMICSASSFFPRGIECPPLVFTPPDSLSESGAV